MEIVLTASNLIQFIQEIFAACSTVINHYGTMHEANTYFDNRLYSQIWTNAKVDDRRKALIMATRIIDKLNFEGDVAVEGQTLQFPRGTDTLVPADIKIAAFEEAYTLLEGYEPNRTIENLGVVSRSVSSVKTTYDRALLSEALIHGFTSHVAWIYVKPYLRDQAEITLSRC